MEPTTNTNNKEKGNGALVSVIIIILILVVGGIYYFNAAKNDLQSETAQNEAALTAQSDQIDADIATLENQSDSDETADIEADLNITDVESLDQGL